MLKLLYPKKVKSRCEQVKVVDLDARQFTIIEHIPADIPDMVLTCIITRNAAEYSESRINVISPEDFIRQFTAEESETDADV